MIAAVVDVRGAASARATLARMSSRWVTIRDRGNAAIACDDEPNDAIALRDPTTLDLAADVVHGGAFAAFDAEVDGAVILGRGGFGGRPLFHARTIDGSIIACSRMQPLLLGAAPTHFPPDTVRLAAMCAGATDPRVEATPLRGISRVAPCTALRVHSGGSRSCARPRVSKAPLDGSVEELSEELWRRVVASVRSAMGRAKSVGVLVGGGVDSSGLLAAAVAVSRGASEQEVRAISLDFEALGSDRPYLAALVAELGIVPVRLSPRDAGPRYPSLILDAQPYVLASGPIEQLLFRSAKDLGVDALLSGVLGDEILAGDLRGFAAEALDGAPVRAARAALRLRVPWDTTPRERIEHFLLRPIAKPLIPRWLVALHGRGRSPRGAPWAGPSMRSLLGEIDERRLAMKPPRTPTDRFERFLRWDIYADVADCRGQMEAATGMIRRDIYADEGILDLISRVRPTVVSYGDIHRGLFRFALRGRVPAEIQRRLDKCWFEPAFAAAAEAAGGFATLGDAWEPRALEQLGVVDATLFRASMEPLFRAPATANDEIGSLWSLATQVLACERFVRAVESGDLVAADGHA